MSTEYTQIPSFMDEIVVITGLISATHLNDAKGYVREWNEEKEKFLVELFEPKDKLILIKPVNLDYAHQMYSEYGEEISQFLSDKCENGWEDSDLPMNHLVDDEHEMVRQKMDFIGLMMSYRRFDDGFIDVHLSSLENIIENCRYDDLIVRAKVDLASFLLEKDYERVEELLMSCVDNHYGLLPQIFHAFCSLFTKGYSNIPRKEFVSLLKELYHKCKIIIVNNNCRPEQEKEFVSGCERLLDNKILEHESDELLLLHEIGKTKLNFAKYFPSKEYEIVWRQLLQQTCYLLYNHHQSIEHSRLIREFYTFESMIPNSKIITNTYIQEASCHFELGDRDMLRKCLKEIKKRSYIGLEEQINVIEGMVKQLKKTSKKSPKNMKTLDIQTRMKCNFLLCGNRETYVGEFSKCARCRIVRYCSRSCQKKHWKDIHKYECKPIN